MGAAAAAHLIRASDEDYAMLRSACLVARLLVFSGAVSSQDKSLQKPADGAYEMLRESVKEKNVLPLKDNEVLVVYRHAYLKKGNSEPVLYLVIQSAPDAKFDLSKEPDWCLAVGYYLCN